MELDGAQNKIIQGNVNNMKLIRNCVHILKLIAKSGSCSRHILVVDFYALLYLVLLSIFTSLQ